MRKNRKRSGENEWLGLKKNPVLDERPAPAHVFRASRHVQNELVETTFTGAGL